MSQQPLVRDQLLDLMRQFQPTCILAAAAELDLFTPLVCKAMDAPELAQHLHTDPRATVILLDALAALDLLEKQDACYRTPAPLAPYLTEGGPDSILPGLRHLANCQRRWGQLARVTREGAPACTDPSIRGEEADLEAFIGAMQNFTDPVIEDVIGRLDLPAACRLLDVGGASGNWTAGFLRRDPAAHATLFDQPSVLPLARAHLTALGLIRRVTLEAGDYLTDALPGGMHVAWLSAVAHQHSRSENQNLFARIHAALAPGGSLLIRDIVLEESRTEPVAGALFAVNMLVATAGGNSYTLSEYREDLHQAGFRDIVLLHADEGMNALIQARRA